MTNIIGESETDKSDVRDFAVTDYWCDTILGRQIQNSTFKANAEDMTQTNVAGRNGGNVHDNSDIICEPVTPYRKLAKYRGARSEVGCESEEWIDRVDDDIEDIHKMFYYIHKDKVDLENELMTVRRNEKFMRERINVLENRFVEMKSMYDQKLEQMEMFCRNEVKTAVEEVNRK